MRQISLAPGVNHQYLAVINGSTLHVLDRITGRQKFERVLGGAPGTGPALSDTTVFVCMVNGLIEGYNLEDERQLPWIYRAAGSILTQPVVSDGSIAWTTDRGYFYVGDSDPPKVRLRVETKAEITSRPAHWTPYLYACSLSGFLYGLSEETGQTAWKFPAGSSLSTQPAAVNGVVYVAADAGGMFAVDGQTGAERWFAPHISQFCCVQRIACLCHRSPRPYRDPRQPAWNTPGHVAAGRRADQADEPANRSPLFGVRRRSRTVPARAQPIKTAGLYTAALKRSTGKSEQRKREEAKADHEASPNTAEEDAAGEMPADENAADAGADAPAEDDEAMSEEKDEADPKNPFN